MFAWVKVLIVLFGIYIILFGHLTPGGGFAGGVFTHRYDLASANEAMKAALRPEAFKVVFEIA